MTIPNHPQATISFPGLQFICSATATLAHGISPSAIRVDCLPQPTPIAEGGDLKITFGPDVEVIFKDCKIDSGSFTRNSSGQVVSLAILDRRWKWKFGQISGAYNLREKDGKIIKNADQNAAAVGNAFENTEKTPKELAKLCLEAMGETDYDLNDLPDDARPTVNWEYENPANALQELCDELGCRIVLQTDNKVAIRRIGEKAGGGIAGPVPNGPFVDGSQTVDPPERPDAMVIVTAPIRYQVDLPLRAMALDSDEKVIPLDDASYNPLGAGVADGFANIDPPDFKNITDANKRELAKKSVFRWYQLDLRQPLKIPGYDKDVTRLSQIVLEDEQVETVIVDGEKKNKPARAFGVWWRPNDTRENTATKLVPMPEELDASNVSIDFTIDRTKQLVKFSEMVVKLTDGKLRAPAEIRLRVAVSIKDPDTGALVRYEHKRDSKAKRLYGTKPRYVKHDEIIPTRKTTYDADTYALGAITDNNADVDKECDYYLDAAEREYQTTDPTEVTYAGIAKIELDGAIQSITWSIPGGGPASTAVSRNQDQGSPVTVPYKLRRNAEKNKDNAEFIKGKKKFPPGSQWTGSYSKVL